MGPFPMPDETHLAHALCNYSFRELESAVAVPWSEVYLGTLQSRILTFVLFLSLMFRNLGVYLCACDDCSLEECVLHSHTFATVRPIVNLCVDCHQSKFL